MGCVVLPAPAREETRTHAHAQTQAYCHGFCIFFNQVGVFFYFKGARGAQYVSIHIEYGIIRSDTQLGALSMLIETS